MIPRATVVSSLCRRCPGIRGHVCVTARLLPNVRCKFPLSRLTRSAPTFRRIAARGETERCVPREREREREERPGRTLIDNY